MTENIVTGKKFKILSDAVNDIWDRISFWTKASDVYYEDDTTVEENKAVNILQRNRHYDLGDIAYESTAPSWVMLKCTQAGRTSNTTPGGYSSISYMPYTVTDGDAKFSVCDIRPSSGTYGTSYAAPTLERVNEVCSNYVADVDIYSGKPIDPKTFYFDYHNNRYGFNTSRTREMETFHPFKMFYDWGAPFKFWIGSIASKKSYTITVDKMPRLIAYMCTRSSYYRNMVVYDFIRESGVNVSNLSSYSCTPLTSENVYTNTSITSVSDSSVVFYASGSETYYYTVLIWY